MDFETAVFACKKQMESYVAKSLPTFKEINVKNNIKPLQFSFKDWQVL